MMLNLESLPKDVLLDLLHEIGADGLPTAVMDHHAGNPDEDVFFVLLNEADDRDISVCRTHWLPESQDRDTHEWSCDDCVDDKVWHLEQVRNGDL